ncbi:MAG: hypothetical protein KA354_09100 [Phycisphaerae bacterium]|nr:hypothetical protein [Phycisphaerae bacterium]
MNRPSDIIKYLGILSLGGGLSGCIIGNRPNFVEPNATRPDQRTYFLDGAGNYGFGKETVPLGLADGGYEGFVEHFIWTTYLGPLVDQVNVTHNRGKATELARRIEGFLNRYPDGQVNLIGLSAGSGIAIFALEALRPNYKVDNVVMLDSSLSANYDLSWALTHVRGGIYFLWSPDDPVLREVVPMIGTVDRSSDKVLPAGVYGARLPRNASRETVNLYRKVHNVPWQPQPLVGPVKLQHAGSISRAVICDVVAPIIVRRPPPDPPAQAARRTRRASPPGATPPRPARPTPDTPSEAPGDPLPPAEQAEPEIKPSAPATPPALEPVQPSPSTEPPLPPP